MSDDLEQMMANVAATKAKATQTPAKAPTKRRASKPKQKAANPKKTGLTAREKARELARERYDMTPEPAKTGQEGQRVPLFVELEMDDAVKLEALTVKYGGKKKAISALIQSAKL